MGGRERSSLVPTSTDAAGDIIAKGDPVAASPVGGT